VIRAEGTLRKMESRLAAPIEYTLPVGEARIPLNALLGQPLQLDWNGRIECVHCGRTTRRSFGQGHCYPCFKTLASCDRCIVQPELCHYSVGTCREPAWGEQHCLIPHTVYLANSSGLKVGITRGLDATTRWIDQGAAQALPIRVVASRLEAGHVEVALKAHVSDRTNWRAMLRGQPPWLDLVHERDRLLGELERAAGDTRLPGERPPDGPATEIAYPIVAYPTKIVSHNLEKSPELSGTLLGIKGQYLIFDSVVINVRKYAGYWLRITV
jgi:hypothetical protein